jgi:16S rRNA (uracil1498-N3)-methyltransferase
VFWTFAEAQAHTGGQITISGAKGHHLARVLRVKTGEPGVIVAGGRERVVEVVEVKGSSVVTRVLEDRPIGGEPAVSITLWQAVLPNPDFDTVVENTTGVGIHRIVAIQASRSIARPAPQRVRRWQSIATAAAEQSHRGQVPVMLGPMPLPEALAEAEKHSHLLVLHPAAAQPLSGQVEAARSYTIAVGPEGGWTEAELSMMHEHGGIAVTLGRRVLRARLAAVVATAILVQQS